MTDLIIFRGNTVSLSVTVTASGSVYNLTGCSLTFTAKIKYTDTSAVFQKTIGNGITVTTPTSGLVTIVISPSDTLSLSNAKQMLVYDLEAVDGSGNVYTLASGNLIVYPKVT